jgi:hypothetical protein
VDQLHALPERALASRCRHPARRTATALASRNTRASRRACVRTPRRAKTLRAMRGSAHAAVIATADQPPGSANVSPATNGPPNSPNTAMSVSATFLRTFAVRVIAGHLFCTFGVQTRFTSGTAEGPATARRQDTPGNGCLDKRAMKRNNSSARRLSEQADPPARLRGTHRPAATEANRSTSLTILTVSSTSPPSAGTRRL